MIKRTLMTAVAVFAAATDLSLAGEHPLTYQQHVEKIKAQAPDADFKGLRVAYTDTEDYVLLGDKPDDYGPPMFKALGTKNYPACISYANDLLEVDYTSMNAHYSAWVCNEDSGKQADASYHRYVLKGLIDSIKNSGDGQSTETAFVMISNEEIVAFLEFQGLEIVDHSIIEANDKSYDVIQIKNKETGEQSELTFDITLQASKRNG